MRSTSFARWRPAKQSFHARENSSFFCIALHRIDTTALSPLGTLPSSDFHAPSPSPPRPVRTCYDYISSHYPHAPDPRTQWSTETI
ncbi:hypothetical protein CGMCC3_g2115 [Colletotrichum fructicola]|uniref:Uncharacterized protein n=1 Tax=Colletotrichum fructicola (strain Nara gc5) TaxID=1213859 RepID=A0A7J6JGP2_COLFN|nr:uncharacterized protein CGMCC3_g2115 [Colletotrichum fructicola]KAE9581911.1 hypothetical protein CGMCC3_g2115 [Colletotrichum fructicola]KAF4488819.1 hypothetical protein CGGC5_v003326 [Colletotrichum fructicola Nara gc5]KAF5503156.1 hypothetical protein CGCF413_v005434 [Colletotrichum fructicola]